jgi:hypothetical protein
MMEKAPLFSHREEKFNRKDLIERALRTISNRIFRRKERSSRIKSYFLLKVHLLISDPPQTMERGLDPIVIILAGNVIPSLYKIARLSFSGKDVLYFNIGGEKVVEKRSMRISVILKALWLNLIYTRSMIMNTFHTLFRFRRNFPYLVRGFIATRDPTHKIETSPAQIAFRQTRPFFRNEPESVFTIIDLKIFPSIQIEIAPVPPEKSLSSNLFFGG